jgi:hypothetical protein
MIFPWFKKKEKFVHVKTFNHKVSNGYYTTEYYIHCYENDSGNRKIEIMRDGHKIALDAALSKSSLYQTKIYRWLGGRRDPDIPVYSEIDEDDTANFLKGKV